MTTPSDDKNLNQTVESLVNTGLDNAIENMSSQQQQDIALARKKALIAAQGKGSSRLFDRILGLLPTPQVMVPVSLAVCLAILVNYLPTNEIVPIGIAKIQPLPVEVLDASIPTENLMLLQDLEFAQWLAEQDAEQEVVL